MAHIAADEAATQRAHWDSSLPEGGRRSYFWCPVQGLETGDPSQKRFSGVVPPAAPLIFLALLCIAGAILWLDHNENLTILLLHPREVTADETSPPEEPSDMCKNQRRPPASNEALPRGIVQDKSNFEFESLGRNPEMKEPPAAKSLLAIPVGIKQKAVVDNLVSKFPVANFTLMLFHYDGVVEGWSDLPRSRRAVHVAAADQTKWWFGKRFLHPDLVAEYDYIFLWDEDIEVDDFDPLRYLDIVRKEGLEISQPALDRRSKIHHQLTARARRGGAVHRRFYKTAGGGRCYGNSTGPPCTGWVEMMVPVFSRAAWRMIQNDLVFAWGLDFKLGYCAQGDRTMNVGIVDSEYVLHRGIPTLGDAGDGTTATAAVGRSALRQRSSREMQIFNRRWNEAVAEDECWTDPYPEPPTATTKD
ncbi:uncharacterized protein LOC124694968 [Lolium rigidum]|uniref:uncharacterized protein LOC124694968 n=1 Tax=Lolium rigidum TaxID=89674 RepID=UPI001F5C5200|nr:uncharacterized protein LOC124694968 [Lolium rigidum]